MYVMMSVHQPRPEHEAALIDSMHRFGAAAKTQRGLISIHALRDRSTGKLVGLALWESEDAARAALPAMRRVIEGDDFEAWEMGETELYQLTEV